MGIEMVNRNSFHSIRKPLGIRVNAGCKLIGWGSSLKSNFWKAIVTLRAQRSLWLGGKKWSSTVCVETR